MVKLYERTDGNHVYMSMLLDNKRHEEIDVYFYPDGTRKYITSADHGACLDKTKEAKESRNALRDEIIRTFNTLY